MNDPEFFSRFIENVQNSGLDESIREEVYVALLEAAEYLGEDAMNEFVGIDEVYDTLINEYYLVEDDDIEDDD